MGEDVELAELGRECGALHQTLFRRPPGNELLARYVGLQREVLGLAPLPRRLLGDGVDLEALELAWRLREPMNPLTQKLFTLCYLAESQRAYQPHFVNRERRRVAAAVSLGWHGLRSAWKLLKGRILLARLDGAA